MIKLYVYDAQTFYEGDKDALEQYLYPCLRVRDKNAYWKARYALKRMAYFSGLPEDEREEKKAEIIEALQWIKFYDGRSKSFLTGLLPRVLKRFEKHQVEFQLVDERRATWNFKPIGKFYFLDEVESRQEQVDAVNAALKEKRGILHMATNAGKTIVAAAIIKEVQNANRDIQKNKKS